MGYEVAAYVIAAAAVAGAAVEVDASRKQQKLAEEEAALTKAENVAASQDKRRADIREERVKRAMMEQQAENTGLVGSSVAIGSAGALNQNVALQGSAQAEQTLSANRRSSLAQRSANVESNRQTGQAVVSIGKAVGEGMLSGAGGAK